VRCGRRIPRLSIWDDKPLFVADRQTVDLTASHSHRGFSPVIQQILFVSDSVLTVCPRADNHSPKIVKTV